LLIVVVGVVVGIALYLPGARLWFQQTPPRATKLEAQTLASTERAALQSRRRAEYDTSCFAGTRSWRARAPRSFAARGATYG